MTSDGVYKAAFAKGSKVRIADRSFLEGFLSEWKYHNKLQPGQLVHANEEAIVDKIGFYHGGDVLYNLLGIPGIWHEQCLRPISN